MYGGLKSILALIKEAYQTAHVYPNYLDSAGCTFTGAQVCRTNPEQKGKYIKIILALLQSRSTAVVYECAVTLVSLSSAPTAVRAAANCFCQLLVSQSDNNVRLIVLDRLQVRA